jgi:hypothetical protein
LRLPQKDLRFVLREPIRRVEVRRTNHKPRIGWAIRKSHSQKGKYCKGETIQINSVNGQKSPQGKDTFGNVALEILPGDYHLTVSFSGRSWTTVFGESYNYQIFFTNNSLHNVDITMKAEAGHTYLVTSNYDYQKSTWYAVVRDETDDRRILKEGPYPLNKIRTGDNQTSSRVYRNN